MKPAAPFASPAASPLGTDASTLADATRRPARARSRIAVIDMAVTTNSPAGSCVRTEVEGLLPHVDVTVFAERCDLPAGGGLEWVAVRAPMRPVLLRYLAFHLSVPLHLAAWKRRGGRAAVVQATQGQWPGADIAYAHFCHAAYLAGAWRESSARGPRRWARWCTHRLNAWYEARAFERARLIVAPSLGLQRELAQQYPQLSGKVRVLANPVAVDHFARPADHDRAAARRSLGLDEQALVFGFMALGDFSRKGLGLLIEALHDLAPGVRDPLRVLVIGGQPGEIDEYRRMSAALGVAGHVQFMGLQRDVREPLWACDAFAFPSAYEIFSLAILQAAAAGLPVLVSEGLYGAEEFVVDGVNGWVVPRQRAALAAWFARAVAERAALPRMSTAAQAAARNYDARTFQARWAELIAGLMGEDRP